MSYAGQAQEYMYVTERDKNGPKVMFNFKECSKLYCNR